MNSVIIAKAYRHIEFSSASANVLIEILEQKSKSVLYVGA
jgi:hypothetical protein